MPLVLLPGRIRAIRKWAMLISVRCGQFCNAESTKDVAEPTNFNKVC